MNSVEPPEGWEQVDESFVREFPFTSFASAAEFVSRIGRIADEVDHHPDVALRYPGVVTVCTTSHDVGRVTSRDVRLATLLNEAI